ncbi:MAG: glycerate kinase, partial [Bacteroidota bacterium]
AAFIEVAAASGLVLLEPAERNPLDTSTFGTGQQLLDALSRGKRNIFLLLGGSVTNDLGLGIAEALGFSFYDANGNAVWPTGGRLSTIQRIDYPDYRPWEGAEIKLLCDVNNPLLGPRGAAHVYAAQKGASPADVATLEIGATQVASLLEQRTDLDVSALSGGGAAGGIGAGLSALIGGQLVGGFKTISELTGLPEKIRAADFVITGEGQVDEQSLQGKVVGGVMELCQQYGKYCCVVAGKSTLTEVPVVNGRPVDVLEIMSLTADVATAMTQAESLLQRLATGIELRD